MNKIQNLPLANKRALVRVDFNVPLDQKGNITDDSRIKASLPTIEYLIQRGAKVVLASHLGRPTTKSSEFSLAPCAKRLSELLHKPVIMAPDCIGPEVDALIEAMQPGDILLLENVRFYPAEEKPASDESFAKKLAAHKDIYINDAFGTAHRKHSSTATVAKYFEGNKAAGLLLEKEIQFLGDALSNPKRPFVAIIGGAKISTKIGVLKALSSKVDHLLIGGAMAYTFYRALGISVGDSLVEEEMIETAKEILASNKNISLPIDTVAVHDETIKTFSTKEGIPPGYQGMDIGDETIKAWTKVIQGAKTILWNGPVGLFEKPQFAKGTNALASVIASLEDATTIAGGGDTVAAIQEAGLGDRFTHLSTGGGASLEFLEFGTLPGIEALR